MTKNNKANGFVEITAAPGCILHRVGSADYIRIRTAIVCHADAANWEEIASADIPPYTKSEYDAKVEQLVRERYSESEEFAIQRKAINSMLMPSSYSAEPSGIALEEYAVYNEYVERCKARAPQAILDDIARREIYYKKDSE